jgi:hypothetical protein
MTLIRLLSKIDVVRIFILAHHKCAVCTADARYRSQFVKYKILVVLHISCIHLQQEIKISRNVITFHYFFEAHYIAYEIVPDRFIVMLQPDVSEYDQAIIEFFGIDQRDIPFNTAARF